MPRGRLFDGTGGTSGCGRRNAAAQGRLWVCSGSHAGTGVWSVDVSEVSGPRSSKATRPEWNGTDGPF
eukprot:6431-Prymnesium_polylepis.2